MAELDPFDVRLGAAVRERREVVRITQAALGAKIGVTFQQIQKYEQGRNRISASRLAQIADVLETSASELLGERSAADKPGAAAMLHAWNKLEDEVQRQAVLQVAKAMTKRSD